MNEFVVDLKRNTEFGLLVALNLVIEGTGAATFLGAMLLGYSRGAIIGLILVLLGALALFFDLGRPYKFWRVVQRTRSAWMSRGAIFVGCLFIFGILYVVLFPGFQGTAPGVIIEVGAAIFAILTILYSGFLLSSMTPIPFWNSPLTPILFLFHSATSGLVILLFLFQLDGEWLGKTVSLAAAEIGLLAATLVFTLIQIMVMAKSSSGARESVRLLIRGESKLSFLGGGIFLGLVIPLTIVGVFYLSSGGGQIGLLIGLLIAAISRLTGDFLFRYATLKAGVFEALI